MSYWQNWTIPYFFTHFDPNVMNSSDSITQNANQNGPFFKIPYFYHVPSQNNVIYPSSPASINHSFLPTQIQTQRIQQNPENSLNRIERIPKRMPMGFPSSQRKKKMDQDYDYTFHASKKKKRYDQTPGRNKISNVLRAFLKLLHSQTFLIYRQQEIKAIIKNNNLLLTFEQFTLWVHANVVPNSPYVNKNQFRRIYHTKGDIGKLIRIMLRKFVKVEGIGYISTINNKKKMFPESKINFIEGLRSVEEIFLFENREEA